MRVMGCHRDGGEHGDGGGVHEKARDEGGGGHGEYSRRINVFGEEQEGAAVC